MIERVPHVPPPRFDAEARRRKLAYLAIDARTEALVHELEGLIASNVDAIVDRFYGHLTDFAETRAVFRDQGMIDRLKVAQRDYLLQAVRGPYDAAYFERRWRIGYIHNVIELEPEWFIGAFQLYRRIIHPLIAAHYRDDAEAAVAHTLALDRIMTLDMVLGLESYWAHYTVVMDKLTELNLKLEAASSAKSHFLANMSHEFRTPLNAIMGFTEVLEDGLAGPLGDEQQEYLGEISRAGKLLLRLIDDVLDLAKVEAGRLELFYETLPLAPLIRDAVTTLRGSAAKKGLAIGSELPPDLGTVEADQVRLKQVLYNLLSNAVKFTERGNITVRAVREDDTIHITVTDTGIGIGPEEQVRVFEEFHQVESGTAERPEGTGLGLALTKRLVEAHGGRIEVESRIGEGSVFHVYLPRTQPSGRRASDRGGGG